MILPRDDNERNLLARRAYENWQAVLRDLRQSSRGMFGGSENPAWDAIPETDKQYWCDRVVDDLNLPNGLLYQYRNNYR